MRFSTTCGRSRRTLRRPTTSRSWCWNTVTEKRVGQADSLPLELLYLLLGWRKVGQADSLPGRELVRCARPGPILDSLHQRGLDRIPFDIPYDTIHLLILADPMIV